LTNRETDAIKQAARTKRQSSHFHTAPDGRLVIDIDDEDNENTRQKNIDDDDDDDDDDIRREDLKDLMETLSLSQRAKNKRKRALDHDDDDDDDDNDNDTRHQHDDKQSSRSKYRSKLTCDNSELVRMIVLCLF
jgi:hypothetical protein